MDELNGQVPAIVKTMVLPFARMRLQEVGYERMAVVLDNIHKNLWGEMETIREMVNSDEIMYEDLSGDLKEIAAELGLKAARFLVYAFGGSTFYVPSRSRLRLTRLRRTITAEYDGANTLQLARKYGTTKRKVDQIVRERSE